MLDRREFVRITGAGLAAGALGAPFVARAGADYVLKYADSLPTTHYSVQSTKEWIAEVEKRSGGRIKIEHYPAEQLASARDLLDAVQTRIADIAYIPAQYFAEKLPLSTVASLPMPDVRSDVEAVMRAYFDIAQGALDEAELKDAGIKAIRASSTDSYNIHMTGKKIVQLTDLAGQKIRVGGNVQQAAVEALGGVPVTVTPPEMYNAMQNGTLDGTVFSLPSVASYKLNDLVKFSTDNLNLGVFASLSAINRDLYDEMPEDLQTMLVQTGSDMMSAEAARIQGFSTRYRKEFRDQGIEVYDLSAEVIAEATKRMDPIRAEWAKLYEARGLQARKVLDAWTAALTARSQA